MSGARPGGVARVPAGEGDAARVLRLTLRRGLEAVGREIARAALYRQTQRTVLRARVDDGGDDGGGGREGARDVARHDGGRGGGRKGKQREGEGERVAANAPTLERFRHGDTIERYDGAVVEAGLAGHRVVEACLLDRLRERGVLGRGRAALLRHSAGLWLRALFEASGMQQALAVDLDGVPAGTQTTSGYAAGFERSAHASRAMATYLAVITAMERRVLYGRDRDGLGEMGLGEDGDEVGEGMGRAQDDRARAKGRVMDRPMDRVMDRRARRRAAHLVREICCWDRLPPGFGVAEIRAAFDRLMAMEEVEAVE